MWSAPDCRNLTYRFERRASAVFCWENAGAEREATKCAFRRLANLNPSGDKRNTNKHQARCDLKHLMFPLDHNNEELFI